jgi:hypothetical protein
MEDRSGSEAVVGRAVGTVLVGPNVTCAGMTKCMEARVVLYSFMRS